VIQYADVDPDHFRAFAEPGWAKTVYALDVAREDAESGRSQASASGQNASRRPLSARLLR
jgi:hypothetical protein